MYLIFARNYFLFIALLLAVVGVIGYTLITGERRIQLTSELVNHTYETISKSETVGMIVESMLSAQRGYLISGNEAFLDEYGALKAQFSEVVAKLSQLTADNKAQQSRLADMQIYMSQFTAKLDERANIFPHDGTRVQLVGVEVINSLKDDVMRVNGAFLKDEYTLLNKRIRLLEERKNFYFSSLLIGICCGTAIILIFNTFLFRAQRKRSHIESSLKETEDRLRLAIEGTQDGIFDWDIKSDTVFYSRRFFEMLGYERGSEIGTSLDINPLIHPEDLERVRATAQKYLDGELTEYHQEFRMKHNSGRWIWIQSRGKALYDDKTGLPVRLVGAHSDITSTVMAQERLKTEKEQAEKANRAKTDFLAHMSHEIRTPLTAISGIAEIFERNESNLNDKQKKLVAALSSSSRSLKDLISDILDFSKIESGELELMDRPFMLDELCQEIASMMSVRANEKGISFIGDYNDIDGVEFHGDKGRLRQILVNLIGNAIKFTNEGSVAVKACFENRNDQQCLRFDVSDTGLGIASENFDMIFERFKQADSSVSRKYGGTGLGLPISRNLARLMGGDIFVSSQIDKGSTFTLIVPLRISGAEETSTREQSEDTLGRLNSQIRHAVGRDTRILVVEDYEGNIVVIGYMLEDLGIKYDVAHTGVEALEKWRENHYELILMDVQMPEMDGFTATKEIRKIESHKRLKHTPIIGMTAHALVGDKDKCIEAGMDAYLPKPIIETDLKREILAHINHGERSA